MNHHCLKIAAAVLVLLSQAYGQAKANRPKTPTKKGPSTAKDGSIPDPNFKKCAELLQKSVVRIETKSGLGTGFPVGDGSIVITNNHVVYDARKRDYEPEITIQATDETKQKGTLVRAVPERDLAALRIEKSLPALSLAEDDDFIYRTPVIVVGHGRGVKNLQNVGVLTKLFQWSEENSRSLLFANDTWLLGTDATVQPGHSGSPLCTPDGLVVGVTTYIDLSSAKRNYAVHVSHIRELMEDAAPDMELPKGKLSGVERIRLDRMRRSDALQKLAVERQTVSRNKPADTSRQDMFYGLLRGALRQTGM